jgi:hypothetical protein
MQMSNPARVCAVKAIQRPSGDQQGSVGLGAPMRITCISPPLDGILQSALCPRGFPAKQIH